MVNILGIVKSRAIFFDTVPNANSTVEALAQIGLAYFVCSPFNSVFLLVSEGFDRRSKAGSLPVAVIGDNTSNTQACAKILCAKYDGLIGVRCAAHSFQLMLQDVSEVFLLYLFRVK